MEMEYSDGGYKVTGPDGAVIAQGGEDLKSDLPKDSVLDDGNRFYSLKVV